MAVHAYLQDVETGFDRRTSARRTLKLETPADASGPILIHNLSTRGLLIESETELPLGIEFEVNLPEAAACAQVMWRDGRFYGCQFANPISKAALSAALLKSPALTTEESQAAAETQQGLPLGLRLWIILGLSIGAWLLMLTLVSF